MINRSLRHSVVAAFLTALPVLASTQIVVQTVPWVASAPATPHQSWAGNAVTLKGVTNVTGATILYDWNPGDGTAHCTGTVSNQYNVSCSHTYTAANGAAVGNTFSATLTVWDSSTGSETTATNKASGSYFTQIFAPPPNLKVEVNAAIDAGLWYLHTTANHSTVTNGANVYPEVYWSLNPAGVTATFCQAFEVSGHLESGPAGDPYTADVAGCLVAVSSVLQTAGVGTVTTSTNSHAGGAGFKPDGNGNGLGVHVVDGQGQDQYQSGMMVDVFAASGTPNATFKVGPLASLGHPPSGAAGTYTYADAVQDMADYISYCQNRGSWLYSCQQGVDNSVAQWNALGLIGAVREFGATVQTPVYQANQDWLNVSQAHGFNGNGYFGYTSTSPVWGPYATTPSGMVQLAMNGIGRSPTATCCTSATNSTATQWDWVESYMRDNFDNPQQNNSQADVKDYYYGMYSLTKAMLLYNAGGLPAKTSTPQQFLQSLDNANKPPIDWYAAQNATYGGTDTSNGVARTLVSGTPSAGSPGQNANGSWTGIDTIAGGVQNQFATGWAIIMLNHTVTTLLPTACATSPSGTNDTAIQLNGGCSTDANPNAAITTWEWDVSCTAGGGTNFTLFGVNPSFVFDQTNANLLPYQCPVRLRVIDTANNSSDFVFNVTLNAANGDAPPVATAGGPYNFCPNQTPWLLTAAGSTNPGVDTITAYGWDFSDNCANNSNYGDSTLVQPRVDTGNPNIFSFAPGSYCVKVQVTNNKGYTNVASGTVNILSNTSANCANCVSNFQAAPGNGGVVLTWADPNYAAASITHYNIYRSSSPTFIPFVEIAGASSNPAVAAVPATGPLTFTDTSVVTGNTYYYRVMPATNSDQETCQSAITAVVALPVVTVTADNKTVAYGAALPALTATDTGFVNGDTAASLTAQPVCVTTATSTSPAGSYPITCSGAASPNYAFAYVAGSLTITKASSSVTVACANVTYNGAAQTPCTATVSGSGTGITQTVTWSYSNNTLAGAGSATATYAGDSNHTGSSGSGTFTIGTAPVTITAGSYTGLYDGNTHALSACQVTGAYTGDITCTNNPAGPVGPNAGSGTVTPVANSPADLASFVITVVNGSYSITQAPSSVAVTCTNVTYNGTAQTPCTATVSGTGPGITQTVTWSYSNNTLAGTGSATATYAGDAYHTGSNGSATFTIAPAAVTITAGNYSGVYDGNTHALTACQVTGAYTGDLTCANNPAGPVGPNVGSGTVTPVANSPADVASFTITPVNGAYSITQATSSVAVTCTNVTYNGAAQTPCTATVSGAGTGITQTVTWSYSNNTLAGTGSATATYAGDSNHSGSNGSATFTIGTAPVTITGGNYSGAYDGTAHALTACQATGAYTGDITCSNNPAGPVGPNVGSGTVAPVANSPADLASFSITAVNGSYSITKATSSVAVTCTNVTYNGAAQTPCTATVSGSGTGITQTVTWSYSNNTLAGTGSATATYAGDSNHAGGSGSATFTIGTAPVTITAGNYSGTYDGNTHALTACQVSGPYTGDLTCANNPAGPVGQSAGSGPVTPVTNSPADLASFSITAVNGSYSIARAPSSVTVTCTNVTYNSAAQTPCTAVVGGVGTGITQTVTWSYANNTNAGTGSATATYAGDTNHSGSNGSATFTIAKAPAAISLSNLLQAYDGTPKPVTAVIGPLYCAPIGVTYNGSPTPPSAVGSYAVVASVGNANCVGSNALGTLIIYAYLSGGGSFVIGDKSEVAGGTQTFWGAQWAKINSLSGGSAPNSFKGFADHTTPAAPACGGTFTTAPGNSSEPPATLPAYMAVVVSSSVAQSGSTISGNIQQIVVIQTAAGYGPDPGHAGTGGIVATVCHQ